MPPDASWSARPDTALIEAPARAATVIFGKPLLERLLLNCRRAGIGRFFIQSRDSEQIEELRASVGAFRDSPDVLFVTSATQLLEWLPAEVPCVALRGNLVIAAGQLRDIIRMRAAFPGQVVRLESVNDARAGSVSAGPLSQVIGGDGCSAVRVAPLGPLPFALDGRPEDSREAEFRLARDLRRESAGKDAPLARWLDRRLSWRISYRLANTEVTPDQVTLVSAALGILAACMFAYSGYLPRLSAALLFLVSTTLDGVDGELARLKMDESRFGARLDTLADNLVHVALFAAIIVGCYRESGDSSYLWLLPVTFGGFARCVLAGSRARSGNATADWIAMLEQATGRDFAYVVLLLAVVDRVDYFAWGTAIGTYVFAIGLWWLTPTQRATSSSRTANQIWQVTGLENRGLLLELKELWRSASDANEVRMLARKNNRLRAIASAFVPSRTLRRCRHAVNRVRRVYLAGSADRHESRTA